MQKLIKNWIFTLIVCILLAVLTTVMFLGAFEIKGFTLAQDILHILVAVILGIYLVLAIFPTLIRYRGIIRVFVGLEILLLILTIVALICAQIDIPFFSTLQVCSVVGIVLWARGAVEIVHAYLLQGGNSAKKIPLWGLVLYILLCAFGMWQLARPSIADKYFLFVIGTVSLVMTLIFAFATAQNRHAKGKPRQKRAAKKKSAGGEDVAFLPLDE